MSLGTHRVLGGRGMNFCRESIFRLNIYFFNSSHASCSLWWTDCCDLYDRYEMILIFFSQTNSVGVSSDSKCRINIIINWIFFSATNYVCESVKFAT